MNAEFEGNFLTSFEKKAIYEALKLYEDNISNENDRSEEWKKDFEAVRTLLQSKGIR